MPFTVQDLSDAVQAAHALSAEDGPVGFVMPVSMPGTEANAGHDVTALAAVTAVDGHVNIYMAPVG